MICQETSSRIMNGLTVTIVTESKEEEEIGRLMLYFGSIVVRVSHSTIIKQLGNYKITLIIFPAEVQKQHLIVSALDQSNLNFSLVI